MPSLFFFSFVSHLVLLPHQSKHDVSRQKKARKDTKKAFQIASQAFHQKHTHKPQIHFS